MTESKKSSFKTSKLSQLSTGLLVLNFKKEIEEPGYSAIDQKTYEHAVVGQRYSYCSDLIRVLGELKLTAVLLSEVNEQKRTDHKTHQPEELIAYYSGIFLDQVHQIKDKLLRTIDYMAATGPFPVRYQEPREVSPSKLHKKYGQLLRDIGIENLIEEWQESKQPIGVVLRKRTKHHHGVSRVQLTDDFNNIQMSRLMLEPQTQDRLTEYGKQRMTKLGEESLKNFKDSIVTRQKDTVTIIESNLNAIAEKLIAYYKVPTDPLVHAKIGSDYTDFLASLRIVNEASITKIQPIVRPMVDSILEQFKAMGDRVVSIYLVGSVARGEFIPGSSDINIYVITNTYTKVFESEQPATLHILSEEAFLSDEHQKDRFICWSDGVLLAGKKFEFKAKDFPKPGMLLALLLNRGVIEKLEKLKEEVDALENPDGIQLRLYSLRVTKLMMGYDFSVAMTNKPFYSASRKKKLDHTKEGFPGGGRTLILEQIYNGGRIKYEDLKMLVEVSLEAVKKTYPKLSALETMTSQSDKKSTSQQHG